MNEVHLRAHNRRTLPMYLARGNLWYLYPIEAWIDIRKPEYWSRQQLEQVINVRQYDWRLISPDGAILAESRWDDE